MRKENRYHKRFIELFMSENIIGIFSRYKGAAKEVTESMAMVEAAKKVTRYPFKEYLVFVVGDGCSPRTGAMFAYMTAATVHSIDPNMNMVHWDQHCEKQELMGFPVKRLTVWDLKIEDFGSYNCNGKPIIVAWPHSHASMLTFKPTNFKHRIDIAMPCCYKPPTSLMKIPHLCYEDTDVLSPKNMIHIWETEGNIKEEVNENSSM